MTEAEGERHEEDTIVDEQQIVVSWPIHLAETTEQIKVGYAHCSSEEGQCRCEYEYDQTVEHYLEEGRPTGVRTQTAEDGQRVQAHHRGAPHVQDEQCLHASTEDAYLGQRFNPEDEGACTVVVEVEKGYQQVEQYDGTSERCGRYQHEHGQWVEDPGHLGTEPAKIQLLLQHFAFLCDLVEIFGQFGGK